jgi:hypothetical protein
VKVELKYFLCKLLISFFFIQINYSSICFRHKILQLLKLNPQISEVAIEQRIGSFFRRFVFLLYMYYRKKNMLFCSIPPSVRPRDYDRTAVMRLIHECMGLPASPPVTSEDSEVDGDSPPPRPTTTVVQPPALPPVQPQSTLPSQKQQQQTPAQMPQEQDQPVFNPQLITMDERTLQLHFTPLYFGKKWFISYFFLFFIF